MKEFEEKFPKPSLEDMEKCFPFADLIWLKRQEGWKAALEWILSINKELDMKDWDYVGEEIIKRVEKELKDTE